MPTRNRALHKIVRDRFDEIATHPNELREFRLGIGHSQAPSRLRAARDLEGCATVLDIACGPAVMLETLYDNEPVDGPWHYHGVDSSPELLKLARDVAELAPPNVAAEISEADCEDLLTLGPCSYEGVLVRHLLEHLQNPLPALAEAVRLCTKRLVLIFSQYPVDDDLSLLTDTHMHVPRFAHARGKLEKVIAAGGFSIVSQDCFEPAVKLEGSAAALVPREAYWVAEPRSRSRHA